MRKTKKYYKTILDKFETLTPLAQVVRLKELIKKYGAHISRGKYALGIHHSNSFWNCYIYSFSLCKDTLYINIYWQGNDIDGTKSIEFRFDDILIPAETYFDGYRTRTMHSDLRISKSELLTAIKSISNEL